LTSRSKKDIKEGRGEKSHSGDHVKIKENKKALSSKGHSKGKEYTKGEGVTRKAPRKLEEKKGNEGGDKGGWGGEKDQSVLVAKSNKDKKLRKP